jgi:diguanylate cyclase (GGDEF)-like protein
MTICYVESIVQLAALLFCKLRVKNPQFTLDLYLLISGIGILLVSLAGAELGMTIMFFTLATIVSSQLFGVRAALRWYLVSVAVISLHYVVAAYMYQKGAIQLDELSLAIGVASCIFFCCWQGEQFYQERTKDLFDFSEGLQKKSEHLHHLAVTDSLTGLVNRFQFKELLKAAVARATGSGEPMALFLVDMNGFKVLNDTLGHAVGDKALIEIANRLEDKFGTITDIARLGGDEFCVILEESDDATAENVAREMREVLTTRYVLDKAEVALGASIGYAFCPTDTCSDEDLLAFADTAMYHAKSKRVGFKRYEPEMTEILVNSRSLQDQLSGALDRGEFFLVYQPQIDLSTGNVFGVEALLRWKRDGETIPPFRFIPSLEESFEIIPVSKWIIRECCRQLALWSSEGYDISISINVSPIQFRDPEFLDSILQPIMEFGIDATKLDFEITESILVDDVEDACEKLGRIRESGASISIDDFGTGYSSLAYLRQFPVDRLKIDRAFIKDIPNSDDGAIASGIVVLAKALGMEVLAEGVETESHVEFLKRNNCDQYQGYLFSRPIPPEEVEQYFQTVASEKLHEAHVDPVQNHPV